MALSGLEIFKLLPKTNCGDCGVPTCMAFAMKLAQKKAELSDCPHASEEAQAALGASAEPPIRLVKIGGANALEVGNETVLFRHEKTFVHPTGIAIEIRTSDGKERMREKIRAVEGYRAERVGEEMSSDLFFVTFDTDNPEDFVEAVRLVKEHSSKGVILNCADEGEKIAWGPSGSEQGEEEQGKREQAGVAGRREALRRGAELLKDERPAVFLRSELTDDDIELARSYGASLILRDGTFEGLEKQAVRAREAGLASLVLNLEAQNPGQQLQNNTILRRSALKRNFKPFGYPLFARSRINDEFDLAALASLQVCKYVSLIVLPEFDKALLYTLFTLRQNIYTDPQKPIQVDAKVYPIGDPGPDAPVFVTTNFSLTYFMVSGEIENSGISAHLVVTDVEGQSVLTAWAAGKFVGETIAKFIKDIKLEEQVRTRKIVIPGFVSQISGDLEDGLPGWKVIVGPREASDIPSFVKSVKLT
jgi:acetyl-CoA decarbonylase/synthase complex subunit gamma